MARISQDEIDRIKREVSIERLVQAHGIELKPHGKNFVGRCPWHDDKTPSLVITPDKNLWHCLGACSKGGSVIDWVIRAHGVSYRHALEILRSDQIPSGPVRPVKHGSIPMLPAPVDFTADDHTLSKQTFGYYHEMLKKSPEALAYLTTRGITSPEVIERFHIGFANRTLCLRLPEKNRKAGAEIRARLQKIGILRESGHEHFNGSIVIPIFDEHGRIVEAYGRKITPNLRPGTPDHLYLPGPHHGVFNAAALEHYSEIILCEALIDALTFLSAGFPNVTASYGVAGFTPDHWAAFRRCKTKRVLIAYDRDDAGDRAADELAPKLMDAGIECFRIQFPRGMDANDYALKVQPARQSLGLVIRKAVWMGKGVAPARGDDTPVVIESAAPAPVSPPPALPPPTAPVVSMAPANPAPRPEPGARPVPPRAAPAAATPMPLPASPQPAAPAPPTPIEKDGPDIRIALGDRSYRIREVAKNTGGGQLKVNLLVTRGDRFHVDALDLYLARPRVAFARDAALELGLADDVIKKDLGHILRALEDLYEEKRKAAQAPKKIAVDLTPEETAEALEFLRDPRLMDRILEDFRACGVVGEETNLLVGYLAGVSRNLDTPVAVVIQSSSAAGKSSLMEAILAFIPDEHYEKYSAMTGQSLFYMGEADLQHKVLAIVEEEGAERASYALKLLQSEGELTIASTGKDPATGRHVTHEYSVEGPVMIFLTTTAVEIDEELLNRCIVLTVNEDREQTRSIHDTQRARQTLAGQLARRDTSKVIKIHQDAQRLVRPLLVANEYGPLLTFRDDQTRMRRDHGKYLTLIRSIALVHQHQRPVRTIQHRGETIEYIDVTREDIRIANRLAHEVLGRTLDELPPQSRRLLHLLDRWVNAECERHQVGRLDFRFQRKDVRPLTGWRETQARVHLEKLVELEYVVVHRGVQGQSFVYELVYSGEGQDGQPFVMGLVDPDTLPERCEYDGKFAGPRPEFADASRPRFGPDSAGSRVDSDPAPAASDAGSTTHFAESAKITVPDSPSGAMPSYPRNGSAAGFTIKTPQES